MLSFLMLLAMAPQAEELGDPPAAAPVAVTRSTYSGSKIQIDVELGDTDAYTRIYEEGSLIATLDPGIENYPTGRTSVGAVSASHYLNGQETSQTEEA